MKKERLYQNSLGLSSVGASSEVAAFFVSGAKPPNKTQNWPVSASDPRVPSSAVTEQSGGT